VIPVHRPIIGDNEAALVLDALRAGDVSGSSGHYLPEFEQKFAAYCECVHGIAVSSGSTALHLAAVLSNIAPGDEVLVSACTNIASANAVVQQGGVVVPIDSEPGTWNMDVRLLEGAITPRTRAIMPVHIYGHPVDMGEVMRLALAHGLAVIEDCAEAHGALYYGKKVGGIGDVGCFSFYANKVITTGEGGMIVTNNSAIADRARLLRNLAFTYPRFQHREVGYNYRMTNLQAALGVAQFARIEGVIERKRQIAADYTDRLAYIPGLRLPVEKPYARNVYWMYCVVVDPAEFGTTRDVLVNELRADGVETRTMFCPLNYQPSLLDRRAVRDTPCPVAENLWRNGLYLPSGCSLTDGEIDHICAAIRRVAKL
jgi:perosamine synthetase